MLGPSGTVLTTLVERRCFDFGRSPSGQDWNIVIFRVERSFLRRTEEAGPRAHQPFQRKTPLSQVFGSSFQFKSPQPGTPGVEESTVTALVPVMSILLLHSAKGHQDHKDHNELAALDVNLPT